MFAALPTGITALMQQFVHCTYDKQRKWCVHVHMCILRHVCSYLSTDDTPTHSSYLANLNSYRLVINSIDSLHDGMDLVKDLMCSLQVLGWPVVVSDGD